MKERGGYPRNLSPGSKTGPGCSQSKQSSTMGELGFRLDLFLHYYVSQLIYV